MDVAPSAIAERLSGDPAGAIYTKLFINAVIEEQYYYCKVSLERCIH